MIEIKKQLDIDIDSFFHNIETQMISDQKKSLRDLFEKYLHLNTCDLVMDKSDLLSIVSKSKHLYANERMPIHVGKYKTQLDQEENRKICLIEATIMHLNSKECLKKTPKFDKRDDTLE